MSRPLRLEFPHALYHVTARGDRQEAIFEDDSDRRLFLEILGDAVADFNWQVHAYCLMTNHYHLLVETPDGNLSKGMRQLNGSYTQRSNRKHGRVGHVFQGRYKAILVDRENYLLEVARYVVLNPVRAGMVRLAQDWPWSSYDAMTGQADAPRWLTTDALLSSFGTERAAAMRAYAQFVAEGVKAPPLWSRLQGQVYLGDAAFVARMLAKAERSPALQVPRAQRRVPPEPLADIAARHPHRDEAIAAAHATGHYSYTQLADFFGVHFTTVGRVVRRRKAGRML
ncbi:MAG: transposase [Pseudomonadota bacterium]